MFIKVELTSHEEDQVCKFALALARKHEHKCKTEEERHALHQRTRIGIIAEASVIKVFNDVLRANERIFLNEEYDEKGGDGGIDFMFAGMSFDVKFALEAAGVPRQRIARSRADMIILVTVMRGISGVTVMGMVPRKKFLESGASELDASHCVPLAALRRSMPEMFLDAQPKYFRRNPINRSASSFMHEGKLTFKTKIAAEEIVPA